jgi:Flp pilus assembly protein TadG
MRAGRQVGRTRRGAAAVEMAVVAPLFIVLVFGMVEASRLGQVAQLLNTAAREGCRVAVTPEATPASVQARVQAVLAGSGISVGPVTPTPANWQTALRGTPVTITLEVPFSRVTWLPAPLLLGNTPIRASATMSSQRP